MTVSSPLQLARSIFALAHVTPIYPERSICCTLTCMATGGGLQHRLEKFVFNPLFRTALRLGVAPRAFALLETTGRPSGQPRLTPVGNGLDGDVFWLVSEHGKNGAYVKNLIANPRVRVRLAAAGAPAPRLSLTTTMR